jgi:hypothetical protein
MGIIKYKSVKSLSALSSSKSVEDLMGYMEAPDAKQASW